MHSRIPITFRPGENYEPAKNKQEALRKGKKKGKEGGFVFVQVKYSMYLSTQFLPMSWSLQATKKEEKKVALS